ncbi:MAG: N-acetylneuraminate lyase [Clostridia bacterium]|nr:N-acetylneuraminate lyase [Clostridia bacterium]
MNKGIYPALLTLFDKNGDPDTGAIAKLVDHVINNCAADGLYVCGSTGENFLMSHSRKKEVLSSVAKAANGRVSLIAHIGSNVAEEVYELASLVAENGYDAVSAVTPFYYKFTNSEVVDYYLRLADRSKLPLVVYNIPVLTSVSLSMADFEKLFSHGNIIGVKNSAQDYFFLERVRTAFPDKIIFSGVDEALLSAAVLGTDGAIGSTYNIIGSWGKEVFENCRKNDIPSALAAQKKINTVTDMLLKAGIYQTLKEVLTLYGIDSFGCRHPFAATTDAQKAAARKIFDTINELNDQ